MIHFEHPARAEEFAAVAVLATLAYEADETGSALPPLWPMVLHSSFTDLILPVPGADADASSSDAASIPELIRALRSPIPRHQHGGALGIRRMLYPRRTTLINDIIASGAVPLLARLLESGAAPPATQFEAAWALAIVASWHTVHVPSTHVRRVANAAGAIKGIVRLVVFTGRHDACEHAAQALGNIAGESSAFRDLLLESDAVAAMLKVASRIGLPMSLRRSAAWTISQLCFRQATSGHHCSRDPVPD
jgi:importin subunit alpha-1